MAEYIYCRTSTFMQQHDSQIQDLKARYPSARIVTEVASGGKSRPILKALIEELQGGDKLIVAALDRLGRRTSDVLSLIEDLTAREIGLISVREGVDYSTPVGKLVTQILVSVAEMERELVAERTRLGMAAAKAKGRQIGRPREIDQSRIDEGLRLIREDGYSFRRAAKEVGVHHSYLANLSGKSSD